MYSGCGKMNEECFERLAILPPLITVDITHRR